MNFFKLCLVSFLSLMLLYPCGRPAATVTPVNPDA